MKKIAFTSFALMAVLAGCGASDDGAVDPALLAEYRAAVPSETQLMAKAPAPGVHAKVGDPAVFPSGSTELVTGINGAVGGIIETMRTITSLEPTVYNSETKEMLWGPYPNDNGFGTVAAYVKDQGEGADFRYAYALLRGVNNDVATMKPVIWGGATPDPNNKDYGAGVTLWDFEANGAFEQANNPDVASVKLAKGRFVAVYAKGQEPKGEAAFVVAVFRGFVPEDKPENTPADLDYFYGRFNDSTNAFDFLDYKGDIDVHNDPAMAAAESVGVHMAFLNEGVGRAEVEASGGDLKADETVNGVECWDAALAQSYISMTTMTGGMPGQEFTDGTPSLCGVFEKTLTELGVPSLADVDPMMMAKLDDVAKNGIPQK